MLWSFTFNGWTLHSYTAINMAEYNSVRTTVDIPESLYQALKKKAAHEGHSVKELVLRGVELELKTKREIRSQRRPPLIDSDEPGSLDLDNAKIYEIISFP